MEPPAIDPHLLAACRAEHAASGSRSASEPPCICGLPGPPHGACAALQRLLDDCATQRRLVYALREYSSALFEVRRDVFEAYLRARGWSCERREDETRWSIDDGRTAWTIVLADEGGFARWVDCVRDAVETIEGVERRTRHEIVADLLREP